MENRFVKYLLYAAGEILLVVIGILIALQVNNWNNDINRKAEELEILRSCHKGLVKDLADIDLNIRVHKRALTSMNLLIDILGNDKPYHDSLVSHFGQSMMYTRFLYSTSAFETLKSKGVNLVSNGALRDQIIDVFDSQYNFFLSNEKNFLDHINYGYQYVNDSRFVEGYHIDIKSVTGSMLPLDFEALKGDQEFTYYLKTTRNLTVLLIDFHYNKLRNSVTGLMSALEDEINKGESTR